MGVIFIDNYFRLWFIYFWGLLILVGFGFGFLAIVGCNLEFVIIMGGKY